MPPPRRRSHVRPCPGPRLRREPAPPAGVPAAATEPGPPSAVPAAATEPAPPAGYRAVFQVREFRAVFAAHLMSLLGVVVCEISLTVLVYDLTGSPLMSALAFAAGFLPYLLGGTLLAGAADRYPARRVLVVCDLVCAACAALMVLPATPVAGLLALRCAVAAVSPVFSGTRIATLADILGDGDLFVLGRSLLRVVSQSALLVGFGAGGVLLALMPARAAIGITVVTFLGSAVVLRLGTRRRPARGGGPGGPQQRHTLHGARAVYAPPPAQALL
ncbi:MFS transporter, partial [Streptomyces chryseus]